MQAHAWMAARATLIPNQFISYFNVGHIGNISALAVLTRQQGWLRELPMMFEPSDLIWDTTKNLASLAKSLASQPYPIELQRVPIDSPSIAALRKAFRWKGFIFVREAPPTPVIDLAYCEGDLSRVLSNRRLADLRRAESKARKFGSLTYELHVPKNGSELSILMTEAMSVEAKSWKVAAGTSLTADLQQGHFFEHFASSATQQGMFRIALLRINGEAIAMQLACEWQRRFWLLKISHDSRYASCSPGQLLIQHSLQYAVQNSLLSYEFMGNMDRWTELWTRKQRRYTHIRAIPLSLPVIKMLAKWLIRPFLSQILRKLR
jgi:hypothetical protein